MATVELFPGFREFLKSLNRARVRYLLIGGYAVNSYGHYRNTLDLDVWIAVDSQNALKLSRVWQRFAGFSPDQVPPSIFLKRGAMFRFGRQPSLIELVTKIDGVEFEACYARRSIRTIDGVKVSMISLADLKKNKKASGRLKDLADLEELP
jgi:predicted nucleotidyltransferase